MIRLDSLARRSTKTVRTLSTQKCLLTYPILIAISCLMFLAGCASPGSIQGGPKDETPPKVDSLASTPTPQTNYKASRITIAFDEWVKLDDPFSQIFISPPLNARPQYTLKGKSLHITFDESEELLENTTYILNLGTSVKDITESNPLENYQFVFSTGDKLDSLGFSGTITDSQTGEPVENAAVMLYKNLADSAIATLPPSYFSRTGKDGRYQFNYLRADTFQIIAYIDEDLDFRYNEETEPLGFLPEPVNTLTVNDSVISFSLSLGAPPVYLDKVDTSLLGLVRLTFTGPITDTANLDVTTNHSSHIDRIQNQLNLYYSPDSLPLQVITKNIKNIKDTITVVNPQKPAILPKDLQIGRIEPVLLPHESLPFQTNWPITSLDTSLMYLIKNSDSTRILPDTFSFDFNKFQLKYPWQADTSYQLTMMPNAIRFAGDVGHDTLIFALKPVPTESLASVVITLTAAPDYNFPPQFILELRQKDKLISRKTTSSLQEKVTFSALKPGADYILTIIRDENNNGIWDPARYPGRKPAEQIQKIEIGNLRVNWVQETEVQLK